MSEITTQAPKPGMTPDEIQLLADQRYEGRYDYEPDRPDISVFQLLVDVADLYVTQLEGQDLSDTLGAAGGQDALAMTLQGLLENLEMRNDDRRTVCVYPHVEVQLSGTDGNVFAIIGAVSKALRQAEGAAAADEFRSTAMAQSSYDEVLQLAMRTVTVS